MNLPAKHLNSPAGPARLEPPPGACRWSWSRRQRAPFLDQDSPTIIHGEPVFRGIRRGRFLETNHAYYYRFKDGRLVEGHTIPVDQTDANAFWSA